MPYTHVSADVYCSQPLARAKHSHFHSDDGVFFSVVADVRWMVDDTLLFRRLLPRSKSVNFHANELMVDEDHKMANRKSEQERRAWCAVFCVFVVAVFDLKTSKKCYSCCWHFAILWPFTLGVMGPIKWKSTWVWVRVCVCKSHSYFFCFRLFESRSPFIFSGVDSKSLSLSFCARHFGCCSFFT